MTTNPSTPDAEVFESARPTLMGVAYRILGSATDAADVVQDAYLAWAQADKTQIRSPRAWLVTVCTRRAIDVLKSADHSRVNYVGNWLPDLVHTSTTEDPASQVELASSVTTAFLLLLERLTPRERAAYVLRVVFGCAYTEVAEALQVQETVCRQLVSRARRNIGADTVRYIPSPQSQQVLLDAFHEAISGGSSSELARLLADDVRLTADSGGKVLTIREVLSGVGEVLAFIDSTLSPAWRLFSLAEREFNAGPGFELISDGNVVAAVSLGYNDAGQVGNIFIMRNPDKLLHLQHLPEALTTDFHQQRDPIQ